MHCLCLKLSSLGASLLHYSLLWCVARSILSKRPETWKLARRSCIQRNHMPSVKTLKSSCMCWQKLSQSPDKPICKAWPRQPSRSCAMHCMAKSASFQWKGIHEVWESSVWPCEASPGIQGPCSGKILHGNVGFNLSKSLPVNMHSEAVACTNGEEDMINWLALICPLTK